jgi:hypothetical protein
LQQCVLVVICAFIACLVIEIARYFVRHHKSCATRKRDDSRSPVSGTPNVRVA